MTTVWNLPLATQLHYLEMLISFGTTTGFKSDFFAVYNGEIAFEDLALSERSKGFLYAQDQQGNPYSPSWYTLNWRNQYRFRSGLSLTLTAENLTNQRYRPYSSGIAAPGFNLIAGASFRF